MPPSVDLLLKPSLRAHHVLFWMHMLPLVLLPMAMQSGATIIAIAFGVALSWVWLRRHPAFGYGPRAVVRIIGNADGRWTLERGNRERLDDAELLGDSYVQSWILMLTFRSSDGRRCMRILLGDEAAPEALRRLRARLAAGLAGAEGKAP